MSLSEWRDLSATIFYFTAFLLSILIGSLAVVTFVKAKALYGRLSSISRQLELVLEILGIVKGATSLFSRIRDAITSRPNRKEKTGHG